MMMRFTMSRDSLHYAAQVVAKVAAKASTVEMSCALIELDDDGITFSATDGDKSVSHVDAAMVEEAGSCLVPASTLARVVKSLDDGAVSVNVEGGSMTLECGGGKFSLPTLDPDSWMGIPRWNDGESCTIASDSLADMVKRVAPFADSGKGAREWATGIHVTFDGAKLTMQATDSYRISESSGEADGGEPFSVLVPAGFLASASGVMHGAVEVSANRNRCMLSCASTKMSTRAISSKYPDISRMWPKSPNHELTVSKSDLSRAVGRASQLGGVTFADIEADGSKMTVTAGGDEGGFIESVPCEGEYSGRVSIQFLKSCIDAMDVDSISVKADNALSPITFYGDSVRACVMPIRKTA
jgi:DNA polymerase-3 subunit beta